MVDIIFNILFIAGILGLSWWWVGVHENYNNQKDMKDETPQPNQEKFDLFATLGEMFKPEKPEENDLRD